MIEPSRCDINGAFCMACDHCEVILGMVFDGHPSERDMEEEQVPIK